MLSIIARYYQYKNHKLGSNDQGRGQYDGQGEYCGLTTASDVFLMSTTQLYRPMHVYAITILQQISYLDKSEVLQ